MLARAHGIEQTPAYTPIQPAAKSARITKSWQRPGCFQPGILHRVAGQVRVVTKSGGKAQQRAVMKLEQRGKGTLIAGLGCQHQQILFGQRWIDSGLTAHADKTYGYAGGFTLEMFGSVMITGSAELILLSCPDDT